MLHESPTDCASLYDFEIIWDNFAGNVSKLFDKYRNLQFTGSGTNHGVHKAGTLINMSIKCERIDRDVVSVYIGGENNDSGQTLTPPPGVSKRGGWRVLQGGEKVGVTRSPSIPQVSDSLVFSVCLSD